MRLIAARVRTILGMLVAFVGMLSFAVERTASIHLGVLAAVPVKTVPGMIRTALSGAVEFGASKLLMGR